MSVNLRCAGLIALATLTMRGTSFAPFAKAHVLTLSPLMFKKLKSYCQAHGNRASSVMSAYGGRAVMSVVKRTSLRVSAKEKTQHSEVLRTRATGKEVDHSALIKRAIKRYPKTLARLAK